MTREHYTPKMSLPFLVFFARFLLVLTVLVQASLASLMLFFSSMISCISYEYHVFIQWLPLSHSFSIVLADLRNSSSLPCIDVRKLVLNALHHKLTVPVNSLFTHWFNPLSFSSSCLCHITSVVSCVPMSLVPPKCVHCCHSNC